MQYYAIQGHRRICFTLLLASWGLHVYFHCVMTTPWAIVNPHDAEKPAWPFLLDYQHWRPYWKSGPSCSLCSQPALSNFSSNWTRRFNNDDTNMIPSPFSSLYLPNKKFNIILPSLISSKRALSERLCYKKCINFFRNHSSYMPSPSYLQYQISCKLHDVNRYTVLPVLHLL
jgi:hypothetical protein